MAVELELKILEERKRGPGRCRDMESEAQKGPSKTLRSSREQNLLFLLSASICDIQKQSLCVIPF